MKILFGIQGTGNGHLSRAKEVIPHLQQYGEVDLFISGTQAEVQLPYPIRYQKHGMSFVFGKRGGIDLINTLRITRPMRLFTDIVQCPIRQYDLVINDYEPITAWACKLRGIPCYGLSHQGAFLSPHAPRPRKHQLLGETLLKHFTPLTSLRAFHFERYDDFIHTPVIRSGIRDLQPTRSDHIAVYLPAVGEERLVRTFSKIQDIRWLVFSKRAKTTTHHHNVTVHPVSGIEWERALASSEGALMGAGFEGPAEALFLQKKLLAVPMRMQYEQQCNAAALERLGVRIAWRIKPSWEDELRQWLYHDPVVAVDYPDETAHVVQQLIREAGH